MKQLASLRLIAIFLFMAASGFFLAGSPVVASAQTDDYCQCYNLSWAYGCDICGQADCDGSFTCCAFGEYCGE